MSLMDIYSKDLRIRALAAVDRGIPRREVVKIFSISLTTLKRWIKMRREGKDLSPGISTGVDESSTNVALTPRSGRAPRGERAYGKAPSTTSLITREAVEESFLKGSW
jgi:transposase-like protein